MQRLNFTLDEETIRLLDALAAQHYEGNKSLVVRSALEALAATIGGEGWVVIGYTPAAVHSVARCHSCGRLYEEGSVLFRPSFGRGNGPAAIPHLPSESWLECGACAEERVRPEASVARRPADVASRPGASSQIHRHGRGCGHTALIQRGRTYYLNAGQLDTARGRSREPALSVTRSNPAACTPSHDCGGHDPSHRHGPGCGHEPVPHGDHVDYLVEGHLHHPHGDHCDDHGQVRRAA